MDDNDRVEPKNTFYGHPISLFANRIPNVIHYSFHQPRNTTTRSFFSSFFFRIDIDFFFIVERVWWLLPSRQKLFESVIRPFRRVHIGLYVWIITRYGIFVSKIDSGTPRWCVNSNDWCQMTGAWWWWWLPVTCFNFNWNMFTKWTEWVFATATPTRKYFTFTDAYQRHQHRTAILILFTIFALSLIVILIWIFLFQRSFSFLFRHSQNVLITFLALIVVMSPDFYCETLCLCSIFFSHPFHPFFYRICAI